MTPRGYTRNRRTQRALSLIELLVCVVIIGILVSISVVSYQGAVDRQDLKFVVPRIVKDLNHVRERAKEEDAVVTVEFIMGEPKFRAVFGTSLEATPFTERTYDRSGLLKRVFKFRTYSWPDGVDTPATFTFFPEAKPEGGKVTFGSASAEATIYLVGDYVTSNL